MLYVILPLPFPFELERTTLDPIYLPAVTPLPYQIMPSRKEDRSFLPPENQVQKGAAFLRMT